MIRIFPVVRKLRKMDSESFTVYVQYNPCIRTSWNTRRGRHLINLCVNFYPVLSARRFDNFTPCFCWIPVVRNYSIIFGKVLFVKTRGLIIILRRVKAPPRGSPFTPPVYCCPLHNDRIIEVTVVYNRHYYHQNTVVTV